MKAFKSALALLGMYLLYSILIEAVVLGGWYIVSRVFDLTQMPALITVFTIDIAIILTLWWAARKSYVFIAESLKISPEQRSTALLPVAAGVCFFLGSAFFQDFLTLPANHEIENTIEELMHSPIGLLEVCFIGPVLEELLLREGILGIMLRRGAKPWVAIVLSAVMFGALHLNWQQFVGATTGGIALGIIYYKTGNVVLSSIVHCLNNTMMSIFGICLLAQGYGIDAKFYELFGGPTSGMTLAIILSFIALYLFVRYCKTRPTAVIWHSPAAEVTPEASDNAGTV